MISYLLKQHNTYWLDRSSSRFILTTTRTLFL